MLRRIPQVYTRAEYVSDAVVHISGLTLALIAAPILITLATVWVGDARTITAVSVYAVTLIAMLFFSALYNMIQRAEWTDRLRRFDQSCIYLKIAGSYTPFLIITGTSAGWVLAGIWAVALMGISHINFAPRIPYLAIFCYLALGWAGVIFWGPALSGLSSTALILVLIAGIFYSTGVIFLIWETLPYHVTIWHVFVLIGTCATYAAVFVEVARAAAVTA